MIKVYVAGPYTDPDPEENVAIAKAATAELIRAGVLPFCPHLTHYIHLDHPMPYEAWLTYDFGWLEVCDALVRLPGKSPGSDREVAMATALRIPVFYSVEAFLADLRTSEVLRSALADPSVSA